MQGREEYRIFPIDTKPNMVVGISLPFNAVGIFGKNYTTQEQVKTNLTNFMLTDRGERVYNVDYGAGLRSLLFNPQGDVQEIRDRILDRIRAYFPQIKVNSLEFEQDYDQSITYVTLNYSFNRVDDSLIIGLQK